MCFHRATLWLGDHMSDHENSHGDVRPRTAVLTRGFDPKLSFGSARPAVFRSSTYVFESPEAAEHAFAITDGQNQARRWRTSRPDLRTVLASQRGDSGRSDCAAGSRRDAGGGVQFRDGGDHDGMLHLRPPEQLHRLYDAAVRRHHGADPQFPRAFRSARHSGARRRCRGSGGSYTQGAETAASCCWKRPRIPP